MGMADIAEVLWNDFKHNPTDPTGYDRDRLSFHRSRVDAVTVCYIWTGYDLPLEELKNFRQLYLKTPATRRLAIRVLKPVNSAWFGQGLANAGRAGDSGAVHWRRSLTSQTMRSSIIFHRRVYVYDGCLMEGISHEVLPRWWHAGTGQA